MGKGTFKTNPSTTVLWKLTRYGKITCKLICPNCNAFLEDVEEKQWVLGSLTLKVNQSSDFKTQSQKVKSSLSERARSGFLGLEPNSGVFGVFGGIIILEDTDIHIVKSFYIRTKLISYEASCCNRGGLDPASQFRVVVTAIDPTEVALLGHLARYEVLPPPRKSGPAANLPRP